MGYGIRWLLGIGLLLGITACSQGRSASQAVPPPSRQPLESQRYSLPEAEVTVVRIPANSGYAVMPAVSPTLQTMAQWQQQTGAIAAINGGFFDPHNGQTTSYVRLQGKVVADPQQNDRLMQNPDLTPYLAQILQRSELRRYQCGTAIQYDITSHPAAVPNGCQLLDSLAAGPQLLPTNTAEPEAFVTTVNGAIVRDALGSNQPNARSAVGLTPDGGVVLVMVAQRPQPAVGQGMTFSELATFMQSLGVNRALNLDGGSSTALLYQGQIGYGKLDSSGNGVRRPVKSILLVRPDAPPPPDR